MGTNTMLTEKQHQKNLNGLIKQWERKREYYGELADTLIKQYDKHLRNSIKQHGNLME